MMTSTAARAGLLRPIVLAAAVLGAAFLPGEASAQLRGSQPSLLPPPQATPGPGPMPNSLGSPGTSLLSPGGMTPSGNPPVAQNAPPAAMRPGEVALAMTARFGRDAPAITGGLVWRIYSDKPDSNGSFRLIREDKSAAPVLGLPPGGYIVHVAFGLASAVRPVQLRSDAREVFEIPAGGVRLEGRVGDVKIPAGQIQFDIYKGSQFEPGDKRPIAQNIGTGDVVLVPEGTYHVVSNYGDSNAVVRSDIRVQVGKLTDVTVTHRAAIITLKLVSDRGGEALANTSWSVLTPGGDVVKETVGAFPRVVLAEGDYRAIARNEGKTFEREFKVITGVDGEVEVTAR